MLWTPISRTYDKLKEEARPKPFSQTKAPILAEGVDPRASEASKQPAGVTPGSPATQPAPV